MSRYSGWEAPTQPYGQAHRGRRPQQRQKQWTSREQQSLDRYVCHHLLSNWYNCAIIRPILEPIKMIVVFIREDAWNATQHSDSPPRTTRLDQDTRSATSIVRIPLLPVPDVPSTAPISARHTPPPTHTLYDEPQRRQSSHGHIQPLRDAQVRSRQASKNLLPKPPIGRAAPVPDSVRERKPLLDAPKQAHEQAVYIAPEQPYHGHDDDYNRSGVKTMSIGSSFVSVGGEWTHGINGMETTQNQSTQESQRRLRESEAHLVQYQNSSDVDYNSNNSYSHGGKRFMPTRSHSTEHVQDFRAEESDSRITDMPDHHVTPHLSAHRRISQQSNSGFHSSFQHDQQASSVPPRPFLLPTPTLQQLPSTHVAAVDGDHVPFSNGRHSPDNVHGVVGHTDDRDVHGDDHDTHWQHGPDNDGIRYRLPSTVVVESPRQLCAVLRFVLMQVT